jgi:hypothetical protein
MKLLNYQEAPEKKTDLKAEQKPFYKAFDFI